MSTDTQQNTTNGGATGSESHSVSTTENSEPVVVQGKNGSEPMVLKQKEPEVLGALVVAEGASRLEVRLRLAAAVQVALQLPANRIEVLPMDTSNNKEGP
jgi:stage III sporulation protein AG